MMERKHTFIGKRQQKYKLICAICLHMKKHPIHSYKKGHPQSPLQRLAAERNWRIAQIRGAIRNLKHIDNETTYKGFDTVADWEILERVLLMKNDAHWHLHRPSTIKPKVTKPT